MIFFTKLKMLSIIPDTDSRPDNEEEPAGDPRPLLASLSPAAHQWFTGTILSTILELHSL
jgi:hypothetical protein